MTTLSAEERTAIQDSVRRLLADQSSESQVRQTMETETGFDAGLWGQLCEMGIAGLLIDEAHGGSGAGPLELELVMEEAGAALLCSPLLASSVIAAARRISLSFFELPKSASTSLEPVPRALTASPS